MPPPSVVAATSSVVTVDAQQLVDEDNALRETGSIHQRSTPEEIRANRQLQSLHKAPHSRCCGQRGKKQIIACRGTDLSEPFC